MLSVTLVAVGLSWLMIEPACPSTMFESAPPTSLTIPTVFPLTALLKTEPVAWSPTLTLFPASGMNVAALDAALKTPFVSPEMAALMPWPVEVPTESIIDDTELDGMNEEALCAAALTI